MDELYDAANMNSLLATAEDEMPSHEYQEIDVPARELDKTAAQYQEGEKIYGIQQAVRQEFQPKQEKILQNVKSMTESYRNHEADDVKQEKRQEVQAAIKNANAYLLAEYTKLLEKDQKMQEEISNIRNQLKTMQESLQSFSPESMAKCMAVGMQFLDEVEKVRQTARQEKTHYTANLYQAARETVHSVYTQMKAAPGNIKEAVKNKTYDAIDKGLRHVSGWFDKGISFMEQKKQDFLNLSPKNIDPQANQKQEPAKIAKKEAKKTVPADTEQPMVKPEEEAETKPIKLQKKEDAPLTSIDLNELIHGNSEKEIRKLVDFMAKSGQTGENIIQAFSEMKAKAVGILQSPEYKDLQQNEQERSR